MTSPSEPLEEPSALPLLLLSLPSAVLLDSTKSPRSELLTSAPSSSPLLRDLTSTFKLINCDFLFLKTFSDQFCCYLGTSKLASSLPLSLSSLWMMLTPRLLGTSRIRTPNQLCVFVCQSLLVLPIVLIYTIKIGGNFEFSFNWSIYNVADSYFCPLRS